MNIGTWGAASAALTVALGLAGSASAGIVNGSFETGDLTGWTANPVGLVSVVTSYKSYGPQFLPVQGSYFADLSAGAGANVYTTLDQTVTLAAGQTITGYAAFQANDYLPFNDDGYVSIDGVDVFASSVAAVGDFGNTPWTKFTFTAPTAGSYTIEAGVENDLDNADASDLLLDDVTAGVPEPATWALMMLGVGMVGAGIRRRGQLARTA